MLAGAKGTGEESGRTEVALGESGKTTVVHEFVTSRSCVMSLAPRRHPSGKIDSDVGRVIKWEAVRQAAGITHTD